MTTIKEFDGTGDVTEWVTKVKAKLISKGYKLYLLDRSIPAAIGDGRTAWFKEADKALGVILTYLHPNISVLFADKETPQRLFEAIIEYYQPDEKHEIERLENEL